MNASDATLIQQTELLREIREELKAGRMSSLAAATGGGGVGAAPSQSGAGFAARAQAMSDHVLAADFANFGWTQAFSPIYRTTAMQDVGALMGLSRSPVTMTQPEYQALAIENLGIRGHNLVGGLLAPGFTSRTNALADEIFANSPRWDRFGSSSSVLGAGYSRSASFNLARDVNMMALSDMRLRPQDYNTIATVGMQAGQFDSIGGTSDFASKLKDLAVATADVTRTLRVSAEEASRMMGTLRSMGITDVTSQRNTLMTVGAAAQVAGLTSGEMSSIASNAAGLGHGLGLDGGASAIGAATITAQMRALTSSGVISQAVMARGGGVGTVASEIFGAEASFAASDAGFYSYLGRAGGSSGFIHDVSAGIAADAGGGMYGMMRSARLRSQMTSRMTDADRRAGMRSYMEQQMRLLGVDDMTSERAQDVAYNVGLGLGMSDTASQAYAASNFSVEGMRASERARMGVARANRLQQRKLEADEAYAHTSLGGQIRGIEAAVGRGWQGLVNRAADMGSLGIGSASGLMGLDFTSGLAQQVDNTMRGATSQRASAASLAQALRGPAYSDSIQLFDPISSGWSLAGYLGGGALGGWGGMVGGAALGSMIMPGIGSFIGGAIGTIAGGYAGGVAGQITLGTLSSGGGRTLTGAEAKSYQDILRATRSTNLVAGNQILKTGGLTNSAAFRSLLAKGTDIGDLNADDSVKMTSEIAKAARETGRTVDEIVNGLAASGASFNLAGSFKVLGGGGTQDFTDRMQDLLKGKANTDVDFTVSENATTLMRYLKAADAGTGNEKSAKEFGEARAALAGLGVSGKAIAGITENYRGMDQAKRAGLIKSVDNMATVGATQFLAEALSGAQGLADSLIAEGEAGKDGTARSIRDTFDHLVKSGDRQAMFDKLTKGTTLDYLAKKSVTFRNIRDAGTVDIGGTSAQDLARRFGIETSFAEDLKAQVASGKTDAAGARTILQTAIMGQAGEPGGEGSQQDREKEIARHLNAAATQLNKLTETIRIMQTAPK